MFAKQAEFEESFEEDQKRVDVVVASLQAISSSWDRSLFFKKHKVIVCAECSNQQSCKRHPCNSYNFGLTP